MDQDKRYLITQFNTDENARVVENPDAKIYLPDPNTSLEAQVAIAENQAKNLFGAAALLESNPALSRRAFLRGGLFAGLKTLESSRLENKVSYLEYPKSLIDRLGPFWYNPLNAESRPHNNYLFSGNIPVFTDHALAHSCLVEDAYGRPMLASGSHVLSMAAENGGHLFTYIPRAGFYEWDLEYLYSTKSYEDDSGDSGIWFLPLEGIAKQNVNYLVRQNKLRILRFVDPEINSDKDVYTLAYRSDVDNLVYFSTTANAQENVSRVLDPNGRISSGSSMNVMCKGNSGSALHEINQRTYLPTGRILGVATRVDGFSPEDTYRNLGMCDNYVVHRGLPSNEQGYIQAITIKK